MRVGPFQQLASLPQQVLPAGSPNPSAVGIHRVLGRRLPRPVASPASHAARPAGRRAPLVKGPLTDTIGEALDELSARRVR